MRGDDVMSEVRRGAGRKDVEFGISGVQSLWQVRYADTCFGAPLGPLCGGVNTSVRLISRRGLCISGPVK